MGGRSKVFMCERVWGVAILNRVGREGVLKRRLEQRCKGGEQTGHMGTPGKNIMSEETSAMTEGEAYVSRSRVREKTSVAGEE